MRGDDVHLGAFNAKTVTFFLIYGHLHQWVDVRQGKT